MEGRVDLVVGYIQITEMVYSLQTVIHPSSNQLIPTQPGVKLTTF